MAAGITFYLIQNAYVDRHNTIVDLYHQAREEGTLAELPEDLASYAEQIFELIDGVFSDARLPRIEDGRRPKTNPLNDNFKKKEFQQLWERINRKAVYRVEFDSTELIRKCIDALDRQLRVTPLQYIVHAGIQADSVTDDQLRTGTAFRVAESRTDYGDSVHSRVRYDLIGKIAENVNLKRKTVAEILTGVQKAVFGQFRQNPEHFIAEASKIISEQKATMIVERLTYDELDDRYDVDIFTANQTGQDFSRAIGTLKRHVYDYAVTDSDVERKFVELLDTSNEVVVYAKLPRGFLIPTPVGDYNPDWAISFREGAVKHVYFVAETKGSLSSLALRERENTKVECARKFFAEIGERIGQDRVKYDVVTSYEQLMDVVGKVSG